MNYLLDTNVCSDALSGRYPSVGERLRACRPGAVRISSVVVAELRYGATRSPHARYNHERLDTFLAGFSVLDFDAPAASAYGEIRSALEAKGTPIGPNDLFIAAQAVAMGMVLVTDNVREFQRVPGLRLENWREPRPRPTARHK